MVNQDLWEYVGESIRDKRVQAGLTLEDLSKMVLVSEESLRRFEADSRGMDLETLVRISAVLSLNLMSLMSSFPLDEKLIFSHGPVGQEEGSLQ
jgi:transcriptional regulator with XRE-family HTH domain